MEGIVFLFTNVLLGAGLAMDAFSVSLANGLNEPKMKKARMGMIALVFAVFQALMPLLGWFFVHNFVLYFQSFEKWIPWIALVLLCWIGIHMIREGKCPEKPCEQETDSLPCPKKLGFSALMLQGVATSIDALSVGFTISEYNFLSALLAVSIIAAVTFFICYGGIYLGKKFGTALAGKASLLGGSILIFIGIEIFVSSFFS
ncbi:MAG: manganese efflux pump [Clostridia bacterium]|nr:manganese efflux pump [Clostridia bacterium]